MASLPRHLDLPEVLPADAAGEGLRRLRAVTELVRNSDFGRSRRGGLVTGAAAEMIDRGRVRFSPNLGQEALYRKELGREPVIYLSVCCYGDRVLWPSSEELAERVYHESLHVAVRSRRKSREEECDAFCVAAEAAAVVRGRAPCYPVMRDGTTVWKWVENVYTQYPSDRAYAPIGYPNTEHRRYWPG